MNAEDSISSEGWFDFSMIGKMLQVRPENAEDSVSSERWFDLIRL